MGKICPKVVPPEQGVDKVKLISIFFVKYFDTNLKELSNMFQYIKPIKNND